MTVALAAGAADHIAGRHEGAAAGLDALAASLPTAVDGGWATAHLLEIVAAVAATAGDLALINTLLRDQVLAAGADLEATDSEVGGDLVTLLGALSQ